MVETDQTVDVKEERRRIAREALVARNGEDPYWLYNLSQCLRFEEEAYSYLIDTAEQHRHDAKLMEEAYEKLESGKLVPAEAALLIAERALFPDKTVYNTRQNLYDDIPINVELND